MVRQIQKTMVQLLAAVSVLGQAFQWTQQAVFAERMRGRAVYWEESSDAIYIKIPMIFVFTSSVSVDVMLEDSKG